MVKTTQLLLLFITIHCCPVVLLGQSHTASLDFWSIEDGLSDRNVHTIFKDQDGLMWLGTRNGLNSFDGYEFRHWLGKNEHVDLRNITRIGQDNEGWLWLQRQDELIFYHPKTDEFQTITERFGQDCILNQFSSSHYASNFENDENGRIYFDKFNSNEIYTYHSDEGFIKYTLPPSFYNKEYTVIDSHHIYVKNEELKVFKGYYKLKRESNTQQFQIEEYFRSNENGLIEKRVDIDIKSTTELVNPNSIFTLFKIDFTTGYQWNITFDNHLEVYDQNQELLVSVLLDNDIGNKKAHFNKFILDGKNRIWLTHQFGVYVIDIKPKLFQFTASPNFDKYGQSSVRKMVKDENKLLALLEPTHLFTLNWDTKISTSQYFEGANKDIYLNNKNDYWIGGAFYLTHLIEGNATSFKLKRRDIWSIEPSRIESNRLWIGTNKGMWYFNTETKQFQECTAINEIVSDSFFLILDIIPDEKIANNYWLCTDKGLFLFDEKDQNVLIYSDEQEGERYLPSSNFQHIYQDKQGIYWIATGGNGMIRWDREQSNYKQFTIKDGLSNDVIYCIYEDDFQNLWMSSDYGISSFNKITYNAQNYLPSSGIGQREFNRISHLKTSEGQIYFGGLNGITTFHPSDFQQVNNKYLPTLVLSSCQIYNGRKRILENKTIATKHSQKIILKPSDYIFDLKFSALSYLNSKNNLYSYQLKKRGKVYTDWKFQKKQSIQLGQLPYGKYQLHIRGTDAFNTACTNEIIMNIVVIRPVYLQPWFLFILFGALLFGIYNYTTWRTRTLEKQQEKLKSEIQKATYQIRKDKQTIEEQAEDLRKLDVLKTRFFANVSHELRTPLTLMLGPIKSILKRKKVDNQTFTFLSTAEKNGHQLLKLVNEILDLNKLEAGKLIVREEAIALYPFLKRLASSFTSYADNQKITFHFDYRIGTDMHIMLDTKKFETIINNLLSNAFKFTQQGGTISIVAIEKTNKIFIQIIDNGRGIHREDLPHIFNRFYQSKQNSEAEGGTGIGLSLCKELAILLGGEISVDSKIGEGSTFNLLIPKKEIFQTSSDKDAIASQEIFPLSFSENSIIDEKTTSSDKPTILVVEDNTSLQNYLQLILEDRYHVIVANNGQDALEKLEEVNQEIKSKPSLIISDVMMPIMNGYEFLKKLKSHDHWRYLPVIMLTARADKSDKLEALRIGVDDYLLKPFDEDELLVRIENLLNNSLERQKEWHQEMVSNTTVVAPTTLIEDDEWLQKLEKTVLEYLSLSSFTTETLAQELTISRRQLNRKIKKYTGLTPNKYIVEIRLQKARELLEEHPNISVKEVSYQVGFQKTAHFSKLFIERFGKRPSEVVI